MIEAKNPYFKYDEECVLKGINIKIKEGSFTAIIGANGSGKTTLAKHFNSLLTPTKGNVLVDGIDTRKDEFDSRKKVGFVFQNFEDQLIHSIVEEDVAFGLENLEWSNNIIKKTVEQTLDKLKIRNLAKRNVNMLSLGQKQMVALAGVLAMNPMYIVFDEPTTMLDAKNKNNIMGVIRDLNIKNKITIILVTNVLDDLKYSDRVIILKDGSVLYDGKKYKLNKRIMDKAGLNDK